MALTVNLKPSGFQPVAGGSLIYQFTEASIAAKTNYRVELEFNGMGTTKYEFRPDASLVVYCDIAPILAGLLKLSTLTTDRLKNTYVKYQAKWNESSDAVVNLTGDVIYFYVGNNHSLNLRTVFDIKTGDANASRTLATGKMLSHNNLKLISGREVYFDFLVNGSLPANARIAYYNIDTLVNTNVSVFDGSVITMRSLAVTISNTGRYYILITDNAGTTFYAFLTVEVIEECANPVYLQWINDYGGLQYYMFDYDQLLALTPSPYQRYLTKLLYTKNNITYLDWLMLNELNKDGVIYNDQYKIGQFVRDMTTPASPVNVITLPNSESRKAYAKRGTFELSIRYPEISNSRVTV